MNWTPWLSLLLGVLIGLAHGYRWGKSVAFVLLRSHVLNGRSLEAALTYEEDVNKGRVPRG